MTSKKGMLMCLCCISVVTLLTVNGSLWHIRKTEISVRHSSIPVSLSIHLPRNQMVALSRVREAVFNLKNTIDNLPHTPHEVMQAPQTFHPKPSVSTLPLDLTSGTIFVSIASFRDAECSATLVDLFAKAEHPERIFVGVVEQFDVETDLRCIPRRFVECRDRGFSMSDMSRAVRKQLSLFCAYHNVRYRQLHPWESKGPTYGRYVAASMYQGERYFMMIDSHNRFVEGWDVRLLRELHNVPQKRSDDGILRAVLSHYPGAYFYGVDGRKVDKGLRFMCSGHWMESPDGLFRLDGAVIQQRNTTPVLQPFTAAGFLFGESAFIMEVPFDPYLDYLFDGEEVLYSARLFTHGWNSYLPTENLLYHFYGRPHAPKVWAVPNNQWWVHQAVSVKRVLLLLEIPQKGRLPEKPLFKVGDQGLESRVTREIGRYGMGHVRTVKEFWMFAEVDTLNRLGGSSFCRHS
jgi:UDP-GlcNAc:polypeptide alpha-N-acetylglucosaminyltransferase